MADFESTIKKVFKVEGKYQNMPGDSGNCLSTTYGCNTDCIGTNHGIGAQTLQEYTQSCPTEADMRALTRDQALAIYKQYFWDKIGGDFINDKYLAHSILDTKVVQSGSFPYIIKKALAAIGIPVIVNNTLSSEVIDVINIAPPESLFNAINIQRKAKFAEAAAKKGIALSGSWLERCSTEYGDEGYFGVLGLGDFHNAVCEVSEMTDEEKALLEDMDPDTMINLNHVDSIKYGWWANNNLYVLIPVVLVAFGIIAYRTRKYF